MNARSGFPSEHHRGKPVHQRDVPDRVTAPEEAVHFWNSGRKSRYVGDFDLSEREASGEPKDFTTVQHEVLYTTGGVDSWIRLPHSDGLQDRSSQPKSLS